MKYVMLVAMLAAAGIGGCVPFVENGGAELLCGWTEANTGNVSNHYQVRAVGAPSVEVRTYQVNPGKSVFVPADSGQEYEVQRTVGSGSTVTYYVTVDCENGLGVSIAETPGGHGGNSVTTTDGQQVIQIVVGDGGTVIVIEGDGVVINDSPGAAGSNNGPAAGGGGAGDNSSGSGGNAGNSGGGGSQPPADDDDGDDDEPPAPHIPTVADLRHNLKVEFSAREIGADGQRYGRVRVIAPGNQLPGGEDRELSAGIAGSGDILAPVVFQSFKSAGLISQADGVAYGTVNSADTGDWQYSFHLGSSGAEPSSLKIYISSSMGGGQVTVLTVTGLDDAFFQNAATIRITPAVTIE